MKLYKRFLNKTAFGIMAILMLLSCERELSDEAEFATAPTSPEVFNDVPVGLTDEFFESFAPAEGYKTTAFDTDNDIVYQGTSSIRIDVPAENDPDGFQVGGIFRDRGNGRNLTAYDALTFWLRGSTTATVAEFGFGTDFGENKFSTKITDIQLTTDWKKVIIPIPDASRLVQERGLFSFIAGSLSTGGEGFSFWIDEIRFENLGTIAQPRPAILNGEDRVQEGFTGNLLSLGPFTQTMSTTSGDVTTQISPFYFDFSSSNNDTGVVTDFGGVVVASEGTTTVTASLNNVVAQGSLEMTSAGSFEFAPEPTRNAANVTSVFSDAYVDATALNIDPRFGGSTTQVSQVVANGNSALSYVTNNFTGIIFESPIDATNRTFIHVDVFVQDPNVSIGFQIRDVGPNGEVNTDVNNGNPIEDDADFRFTANNLQVGQWNSLDIPIGGDLLNQRNNIGAIILTDGPNFFLDNIYFYSE